MSCRLAVALLLPGIALMAMPAQANLIISPIFDSSITSDANALTIEDTINSAISVYESRFSDPITVLIRFQESGSGLGGSSTYYDTVSYFSYRSKLAADATTANDAIALAHLPGGSNNPVNGNASVNVTTANLRAIGINVAPPAGQPDSTILLNTSIMNLSRPDADPSKYDLFTVVSHEIDEALGIGSMLNQISAGTADVNAPVFAEDLFRYDQNGNRSYTISSTAQAWFSIDGTTLLVPFNQSGGGADFNDWASGTPRVQNAFATPGAAPNLGVELTTLDVLGYNEVVPEPSTVILFGTGLLFSAALWKKRRSS